MKPLFDEHPRKEGNFLDVFNRYDGLSYLPSRKPSECPSQQPPTQRTNDGSLGKYRTNAPPSRSRWNQGDEKSFYNSFELAEELIAPEP